MGTELPPGLPNRLASPTVRLLDIEVGRVDVRLLHWAYIGKKFVHPNHTNSSAHRWWCGYVRTHGGVLPDGRRGPLSSARPLLGEQ